MSNSVMIFNYCISCIFAFGSLGYECMCCTYVDTGNKKSVSKVFLCNLKKIVRDI